MFKIETMLMGVGDDADTETDIPMTIGEAREIAAQFVEMRTALRRIIELDKKNVTKYAQEIARDGLARSHPC